MTRAPTSAPRVDVNQLLSVQEVAERLRYRDCRVVRKLMIDTGRAVRFGRRLWLAEADVTAILEAHRVPAPGPTRTRSSKSQPRRHDEPQLLPVDWWKSE